MPVVTEEEFLRHMWEQVGLVADILTKDQLQKMKSDAQQAKVEKPTSQETQEA